MPRPATRGQGPVSALLCTSGSHLGDRSQRVSNRPGLLLGPQTLSASLQGPGPDGAHTGPPPGALWSLCLVLRPALQSPFFLGCSISTSVSRCCSGISPLTPQIQGSSEAEGPPPAPCGSPEPCVLRWLYFRGHFPAGPARRASRAGRPGGSHFSRHLCRDGRAQRTPSPFPGPSPPVPDGDDSSDRATRRWEKETF